MNQCTHLDQAKVFSSDLTVCPTCVDVGDTWVHLRMCLTCGQVGCCDDSKNKHARQHFHESGHPIIMSLEPRENWQWCYADNTPVNITPPPPG